MAMGGTGYIGVGEFLADQRVIAMENVLHFDPDLSYLAPWQMYDARVGQTREVGQPEFYWLTDAPAPYSVALDANYIAGSNSLSVVAGKGKYFSAPNVVLGANNVQYLVTSITYSSSGHDLLTVVKKDAAADANMSSGDLLYILPGARSDKASATASFRDEPTKYGSYCQNFFASVSLSEISQLVDLYGDPDPRGTMHKKRLFEMVRARELSRLYGKGNTATSSGATTWIADGMRPNVGTTWDFSDAVITIDLINAKIPEAMEHQPLDKFALFCPPGFVGKFSADGLGKVLINQDETKWGYKVNQLVTVGGPIDLIVNPLMRTFKGSSTVAGAEFLFVTLDECKKVTLKGGGLVMQANKQNPSDDQNILDIYKSRTGFQWGNPAKHYLGTHFKYA